jgi:ribosomal protein S14
MKYLNREDKKARFFVNKYFDKKMQIKNTRILNKSNFDLQNKLGNILLKLPKISSLTLPKNRCIISCKGRAVLRRFRVSHTVLREYYPLGLFPGVYKKSF